MTNYIALDIALLLPTEVDRVCRGLNSAPNADPFSDFKKSNNHPHITLAMGVFQAEDVPTLVASLEKKLSECYYPLQLQIKELYRKISEQIGQEYQLLIEAKSPFHGLVGGIWKITGQYYASVPATREMFQLDSDELWEPNTAHWVDGFRQKRLDDYKPHISLKCREVVLEDGILPLDFTASNVVVARIGNYCTCRDILKKINL